MAEVEVAKRLSFGDMSLHSQNSPLNAPNLLKAAREPSVENFRKALDDLNNLNNRFGKLQEVAVEQSMGNSESDLTRVKSKFDRLKIDFQNVDVKENFIAALKNGFGGIPDDEQLHDQIGGASEEMKQLKQANDETRREIEAIIMQVSEGVQGFERERASLLAHLGEVEAEMAEQERAAAEADHDDSDVQEDYGAQMEAAVAEERELEKELAAIEAEAAALRGQMAPAEMELESLRVQAEVLEAAGGRARAEANEAARAQDASEWSGNMVQLLEVLGGCSVLNIGSASLTVVMSTHLPKHSPAGHDSSVGDTLQHEVTVTFNPGTPEVSGVDMEPADVPVADILDAAVGKRSVPFLFRELRERVRSVHERKGLLTAAQEGGRYNLEHGASDGGRVRATLPGGHVAVLEMPTAWPAAGIPLNVVSLVGPDGAALPSASLEIPEAAGGDLLRCLGALEREASRVCAARGG